MSKGQIAITGASSGVGEALALHFAQHGHSVAAIGRNDQSLARLADRHPGNIDPYKVDIRNRSDVFRTFESILRKGPVSALINNAACIEMHSFLDQDLDMLDRIIDTNLKGALYATRAVAAHMVEQGDGRIVNIASVAGTRGIPDQAAYCASKHGLIGFADALAQELIPKGVSVATLCPGGIRTPLWNEANNPYPGDVDAIMDAEELVTLVDYILRQPKTTLFKRVIFFPTNEWH